MEQRGKRRFWLTRYQRETERIFFFYATMVMVVFYVLARFLGE